jgi:hypothetical protein
MDKSEEAVVEIKKEKTIHIVVEFSKTDQRKVEFETDRVTGSQIKAKAGIPANNDLGRRVHGKIENVADDEQIEIKNGDHFVVLPSGTIS